MPDHYFMQVLREGLYLALLLCAPPAAAALVVGLVISLFQATTRLSDPGISQLPRVAAVLLALAVSGPWIGEQLVQFTSLLWQGLPMLR